MIAVKESSLRLPPGAACDPAGPAVCVEGACLSRGDPSTSRCALPACSNGVGDSGGNRTSVLMVPPTMPGQRLAMVETLRGGTVSEAILNIRVRPPELCDNGIDDDGDGLADCDDPDCAWRLTCALPAGTGSSGQPAPPRRKRRRRRSRRGLHSARRNHSKRSET